MLLSFFTMNTRDLEPEAMLSKEEVVAYDQLVRKYLNILHSGFIETIVNSSPEKGRFLDVGAGTGWISIGVAECIPGAEIYAVDLSDNMLAVAGENAMKRGVADRITFLKSDAKRLPLPTGSFDVVFSHNMMHHVPEPNAMLAEMKRVLKPGGGFFLRDLKRLTDFWRAVHVRLFGMKYNELMKKEYSDSIRAALSSDEWKETFDWLDLSGAKLLNKFVTHVEIIKKSSVIRAKPISLKVPLQIRFAKSLYVTKP